MANQNDIKFQTKQVIKQAVQNLVLPVCYGVSRMKTVDPELVVFADAHHNERPAAMELLYRKLHKEGGWKIVEHYLDYGTAGAGQVAKHSMRFMDLYAKAGFVVICDNFLPAASCRKRMETKVIQLWHACGSYKKFGYDASDDIPENYHGANVYRNASLVTVSGEAAVGPFTSAMKLEDGIVRAMGVSRTDLYHSEKWKSGCVEHFYREYPEAKGKKVVLWAPTFRGNAGKPVEIPLDIEALKASLGPDYYVLVKLHPHMKRNETCCSIPTEELYPVVDVLIADYSSLIYEYLMFGKRAVLYVPDLEQYRAERGFYMDITEIPAEIIREEAELPGSIRRAAAELPESIRSAAEDGGSSAGPQDGGRSAWTQGNSGNAVPLGGYENISSKRARTWADSEAFMKKYMGACDGHATQRIAEWMRLQKQGIYDMMR